MWLQSDAERVREMAAFPPGEMAGEQRKMELLAARVRGIMDDLDFTGHYSALEALERALNLSSDADEWAVHAVELGALALRALRHVEQARFVQTLIRKS